jgi:parvulin-like peptidyl-prolyl cis-trans isomerase-like protein
VVDAHALAAIARERGVTPEQALSLGTEDALIAQHLRDGQPELARWIERVVLARQVLSVLGEEAKAGGPPTDAEVQAISEARFWELARPRMVRVIHAVVLSPEENPAARALAERIGRATSQVKSAADFETAAKAVPADGLSIKVESLPPLALDGRAVDPSSPPPAGPAVQQMDRDFAAAAQRLARPGDQSPVVRTPFGYHVLYLVAVIEPNQPSLDARRGLLHDEIMSQRATALSSALLEQQRRELSPEQSRSALATMAGLTPARSGAPR